MASSALICHCISSSGSLEILRPCRVSMAGGENSHLSFNFRNSRYGNRLMMRKAATSGGVSSSPPEPPSAPWLMLPPAAVDGSGENVDIIKDVEFVGSSNGWVALYDRHKCDLFLSNPMIDGHIKLPPLPGAADRVILSEEEEGPLALMTFGQRRRRLALCRPRRSNEWTLFGGEGHHAYDNLVYSSRHKRLFCVSVDDDDDGSRSMSRVECWDVNHSQPPTPTLDWVIEHHEKLDFHSYYYQWPARSTFKRSCLFHMKYLVCHEDSGDLFLVVRHVNPRVGPLGSIVSKVVISKYRGCDYVRIPYKTIDFDVFKIDLERRELVEMKDSLQGLAMFVGINHSFAIPAAGVAGLKPDCVYFTDENRLVEPTKFERTSYGGHDNGIFDYQTKDFHACCDLYPIELEKISKILPLPLWYTPST